MVDTEEVSNLTDYFEEIYWGEKEAGTSAKNILEDYLDYRGIESLNAENLIRHEVESLDRDEFRDNFQEFLKKRLDHYHDGSIQNPESKESDLETDVEFGFDYVPYEDFSRPDHSVFMTAKMKFEDFENDEESEFVRHYREDEGLEAFRKLLEQEEGKHQARIVTRSSLRNGSDNALEAYELMAEERPEMAQDMLVRIVKKDLRESMKEILEDHNLHS